MNVFPTALPEVLVLEPTVIGDERGFFMESWNARTFRDATGLDVQFVQDNHSRSMRDVLRGIHYQLVRPQGKLVRVTAGTVFDVAVDLRRSSPAFGRWVGVELSAENRRQLWVPPGFGHGFVVRSDAADLLYKATDYWSKDHERVVRWNDPALGIDWGLARAPILAPRDEHGAALATAELFP